MTVALAPRRATRARRERRWSDDCEPARKTRVSQSRPTPSTQSSRRCRRRAPVASRRRRSAALRRRPWARTRRGPATSPPNVGSANISKPSVLNARASRAPGSEPGVQVGAMQAARRRRRSSRRRSRSSWAAAATGRLGHVMTSAPSRLPDRRADRSSRRGCRCRSRRCSSWADDTHRFDVIRRESPGAPFAPTCAWTLIEVRYRCTEDGIAEPTLLQGCGLSGRYRGAATRSPSSRATVSTSTTSSAVVRKFVKHTRK